MLAKMPNGVENPCIGPHPQIAIWKKKKKTKGKKCHTYTFNQLFLFHLVKSVSKNSLADAYLHKGLAWISLYISYYIVIGLPHTTAHEF